MTSAQAYRLSPLEILPHIMVSASPTLKCLHPYKSGSNRQVKSVSVSLLSTYEQAMALAFLSSVHFVLFGATYLGWHLDSCH